MLEVGVKDLKFTNAETIELLTSSLPDPPSPELTQLVSHRTDGWIACIRLAATAIRQHSNMERFADDFGRSAPPGLIDFLVDEVFTNLQPATREILLRTSITERLTPGLAATLMQGSDIEADWAGLLIEIAAHQVYLVPIDREGEWHRLHGLFRDSLRERLLATRGAEVVRELHTVASEWFASHGHLPDAVAHALEVGLEDRAGDLVVEAAFAAVETERWGDIGEWLPLLPEALIQRRADLLVARCWLNWHRGGLGRSTTSVDEIARATMLIDDAAIDEALKRRLRGHLAVFSLVTNYPKPDAAHAGRFAAIALDLLPIGDGVARGLALQGATLALAVNGLADEALAMLAPFTAGDAKTPATTVARAFSALGNVDYYMRFDTAASVQSLQVAQSIASDNRLPLSLAWATNRLGEAALQCMDLGSAMMRFQSVLAHRHRVQVNAWGPSLQGMALCHQLAGRVDEANDLAEDGAIQLRDAGNARVLENAHSFRARLWFDQGDAERALQWALTDSPFVERELPHHLESMSVTRARILLASRRLVDRNEGQRLLDRYLHRLSRTQLLPALNYGLMVKAAYLAEQDRIDEALEALATPIELATNQGITFPFVELGDVLLRLLRAIPSGDPRRATADRCQALISWRTTPSLPEVGPEQRLSERFDLTGREIEVLRLLGIRMTNKEIADLLCISPLTVKRHVANISSKLETSGRQETSLRASELGLVAKDRLPPAR